MVVNINKQTVTNQILHGATAISLLISIVLILSIGVSTKYDFLVNLSSTSVTVSMGFWHDTISAISDPDKIPPFKLNGGGAACIIFIVFTIILLVATLILNAKKFKANLVPNILLIIATSLTLVVIIILVALKPEFTNGEEVNNDVSIWTSHDSSAQSGMSLTLNWKGISCLIATIASLLATIAFIATYILSFKKKSK